MEREGSHSDESSWICSNPHMQFPPCGGVQSPSFSELLSYTRRKAEAQPGRQRKAEVQPGRKQHRITFRMPRPHTRSNNAKASLFDVYFEAHRSLRNHIYA